MKRQLIAMGLATVLTVPSWIMAAHPIDASAKQVTVSKKANSVITKIKTINNKKSNYIKTTLAARTAYNKLSKTDKKKVSNYKILQKHIKVITPTITKINKLKKDVAVLSKTNYKTKTAKLSSTYESLNTAGKAYVPTTTITKLNSYKKLNSASTSMKKLVTLSATTTSTTDFVTPDQALALKDGVAILNFITAYEKLTDSQKRVLGGSQEAIDVLLTVKPLVKKAVAYDTSYTKLAKGNGSYLKQAYELNNNYEKNGGSAEFLNITYTSATGATSTKTLTVANYTKKDAGLMNLDTEIKEATDLKNEFEVAVKKLPNETNTTITTELGLVNNAVDLYKKMNLNVKDGGDIIGKPIDIVDKKVLAEYKKYETIPTVIKDLDALEDYDTKLSPLLVSPVLNFTPEEITYLNNNGLITSDKKLTTLDTVIKNYLKLGGDQKTIVDNAVIARKINYINDAASIKKGQSISKAYTDGLAKNDLAAMKKALESYTELVKNNDRAMRYVVQAPVMRNLEIKYKLEFDNVRKFEDKMNTYKNITDIKEAINLYKVVGKDKPSGVKLIDTQIAKNYAITKTVIDIEKLKPAARPAASGVYTTKQLNNILAATKLYKKLSDLDKTIVNTLYPDLEDYALEEKEIKQGMAIDTKYLALKPSTKAYNKNAKLVYSSLQDANEIVQPYVVYKAKINALANNYSNSQKTVDDFEILVNKYYSELHNGVTEQGTVSNIKDLKNTYEHFIMPYQKTLDLLEPTVLKKYNEIVPIVDVYNKIFMLKKSPTTAVDRDAILVAIKGYEKLTPLGKQFIQLDTTLASKRDLLNDKEIIMKAQKIDAKYTALANKLPLNKAGIYEVYLEYIQAPKDVQAYVMTSKPLIEAKNSYDELIKFAAEFTSTVEKMNSNSKLVDMQILRGSYNDFKRKNAEIDQFITKATFTRYNMLLEVLTVQSAAKFIQTTKKGEAYETWLNKFNNVENGASMNTIRKALLLFGEFNSVQHAILRNSPANSGEQRERNFDYDEWANQKEVGYLNDAIKLEKRYKALNSTNRTYAREVIKIADELYSTANGITIKKYFLYNVELQKLQTEFSKSIGISDAFEKAVRDYVLTSGINGMSGMKTAYGKFELDPVALNNTDSSLVKKYKEYILAEEANEVFKKLLPQNSKSIENNENLLLFISKYNKLTSDAKTVFKSANLANAAWVDTLVKDEKEIKAAQAVDKKFLALDKSKLTYEADVLKVYNEAQKLSEATKTTYFVNKNNLDTLYASYSNPTVKAQEFTDIVNTLNAESPYNAISSTVVVNDTVEKAYDLYKDLSVPNDYGTTKNVIGLNFVDKAVIAKYNQYAPLVTIKQNLDRANYSSYTSTKRFTLNERTAISEAITLYSKLAKEPRYLFDHDIAFGEFAETTTNPQDQPRYLMNVATDIKAAIAVEGKFNKIKKGDKTYVKNVVDALSSYENLVNYSIEDSTGKLRKDDFPKRFFTETSLYNLYNRQYAPVTKFTGAVDTIPEAVLAIKNFKDKINEVQTLHDYINQVDSSVVIPEVKYKEALDAMVAADEYYKFINRNFVIDGQTIQLMGLVEAKYKTDYSYFMAVYKVNEYLKGLK